MKNAEQLLISTVLNSGSLVDPLNEGIAVDWFREHQREWQFILMRYKMRKAVPSVSTFKHKFPTFRVLRNDDMDYAITEMRAHHVKQSLLALVEDAVGGLEESKDMTGLVTDMYRGLVNLQGEIAGTSNMLDIAANWRVPFSDVEQRVHKALDGKMSGIPTGFGTLDLITNGWQGGDFIVFAARLGQGKTWSLIRAAMAAIESGATVQYFALEQPATQLSMRFAPFLAAKYGDGRMFRTSDLTHGRTDVREYRAFMSSLGKALPGRLVIDDTPRGKLTPLSLTAKIERVEPNIVIIDYLGLMGTPGDWSMMAALSGTMKELATGYRIPVLAANQLNRAAGIGKGDIGPEALSGSDAIGMDADGVITMKKLSQHVMSYFLAKYRHGEDQVRWLTEFRPNEGIINEVSEERAWEIKDADEAGTGAPPPPPPTPKALAPVKPKLRIKRGE